MSLFHQHRPAVMGAVLERQVYCEAICDGRHLHPGTVRMLLACKGWDRVCAITDAMQAAGLPDGAYKLGVNDVTVTGGDAMITGTNIRAGSTLTLAQAVKNIRALHRRGPREGPPPAHRQPREAHRRVFHRRGDIAPGKDADFTLLSDELDVLATCSGGEFVYAAGRNSGFYVSKPLNVFRRRLLLERQKKASPDPRKEKRFAACPYGAQRLLCHRAGAIPRLLSLSGIRFPHRRPRLAAATLIIQSPA